LSATGYAVVEALYHGGYCGAQANYRMRIIILLI